jgi:energy-converting hydrogenase A subunit M
MLHTFLVGTEKAKKKVLGRKIPSLLQPIRLMDFSSTIKKAEKQLPE